MTQHIIIFPPILLQRLVKGLLRGMLLLFFATSRGVEWTLTGMVAGSRSGTFTSQHEVSICLLSIRISSRRGGRRRRRSHCCFVEVEQRPTFEKLRHKQIECWGGYLAWLLRCLPNDFTRSCKSPSEGSPGTFLGLWTLETTRRIGNNRRHCAPCFVRRRRRIGTVRRQ